MVMPIQVAASIQLMTPLRGPHIGVSQGDGIFEIPIRPPMDRSFLGAISGRRPRLGLFLYQTSSRGDHP